MQKKWKIMQAPSDSNLQSGIQCSSGNETYLSSSTWNPRWALPNMKVNIGIKDRAPLWPDTWYIYIYNYSNWYNHICSDSACISKSSPLSKLWNCFCQTWLHQGSLMFWAIMGYKAKCHIRHSIKWRSTSIFVKFEALFVVWLSQVIVEKRCLTCAYSMESTEPQILSMASPVSFDARESRHEPTWSSSDYNNSDHHEKASW